jgi:multiple sugar transport system permease protein
MSTITDTIPKRGLSKQSRREALEGYVFILPWLIGALIFTVGPIIVSLYLSLTDFEVVKAPVFRGFDNYVRLFQDKLFWQSLKVTSIYTFASVTLGLVLSFLVALLLNQDLKAVGLFRTLYYIPNLVPAVASSMLWIWIFNPQFGLLNSLLKILFDIKGPLWLGHTKWALPSLILMSLWGVGGPMLVYLAGLQDIPTELYEAAQIDGANSWKRFIYITIPHMTSIIMFNLIMGLIGSFQAFTQGYLMTNGGPRYATLFYVLYLYQNAFSWFKMGYASAMAWILLLIILVLTLLVFRSSALWVYYEGEVKGKQQ